MTFTFLFQFCSYSIPCLGNFQSQLLRFSWALSCEVILGYHVWVFIVCTFYLLSDISCFRHKDGSVYMSGPWDSSSICSIEFRIALLDQGFNFTGDWHFLCVTDKLFLKPLNCQLFISCITLFVCICSLFVCVFCIICLLLSCKAMAQTRLCIWMDRETLPSAASA